MVRPAFWRDRRQFSARLADRLSRHWQLTLV
ncbi:protein of unknown function [Burkholderia multivorans]